MQVSQMIAVGKEKRRVICLNVLCLESCVNIKLYDHLYFSSEAPGMFLSKVLGLGKGKNPSPNPPKLLVLLLCFVIGRNWGIEAG